MRLLIVLLTFAFAIAGALFGALNGDWISLDFYIREVSVPKGASLLVAVLIGWLLGGIAVWLARVPALKRELRKTRQQAQLPPSSPPIAPTAVKAVNE